MRLTSGGTEIQVSGLRPTIDLRPGLFDLRMKRLRDHVDCSALILNSISLAQNATMSITNADANECWAEYLERLERDAAAAECVEPVESSWLLARTISMAQRTALPDFTCADSSESWGDYLERLHQDAITSELAERIERERSHQEAIRTEHASRLSRAQLHVIKSRFEKMLDYKPLKHVFSFRLLEIQPRRLGHQLTTALIEAELGDSTPPYEALSYTWDTYTGNYNLICNGGSLRITPNCRDALEWLRLPLESLLVWVDSICINQNSIPERNHQVRLIAQIYKQASQVIAWLGTGNDSSRFAFNMIHGAARRMEEGGEEKPEKNVVVER